MRVSSDGNYVFASLDPLGGGPDYLASRPLSGGGYGNWNVIHQLAADQFFASIPTNFVLSPDQTKIFYATNVTGRPGNVGLFHYDILGEKFELYPQAGPHSPVLPTFSADGSNFFLESSFISPAGLYAGTTAAGSLVQISRDPMTGGSLDYVINSYAFVPGAGKVMFEVYLNSVEIFVDIYISDLSGGSLKKVVPQDPNIRAVEGNFHVSADGTTVHFAAMDKNTLARGTYLMNVDGSNVRSHSNFEWKPRMQELWTGCWWGQIELEPDNLYRCNFGDQTTQFLRLDDFSVFSTPRLIDFDKGFVRARQPLVGRISPTELVEFNANTGAKIRSVCANGQEIAAYQRLSTGTILAIRKTPAGEAEVLFASSGTCAVVNRLPAGLLDGKVRLVVSPTGGRVALIADRPLADGSVNENLVYIPLDGRPPIRVDAPATVPSRLISFAQWVLDEKALLYVAPHARVEDQLFLWNVPAP